MVCWTRRHLLRSIFSLFYIFRHQKMLGIWSAPICALYHTQVARDTNAQQNHSTLKHRFNLILPNKLRFTVAFYLLQSRLVCCCSCCCFYLHCIVSMRDGQKKKPALQYDDWLMRRQIPSNRNNRMLQIETEKINFQLIGIGPEHG